MRNKKYLLGDEIPKSVRIDTYKKAIDYYKYILFEDKDINEIILRNSKGTGLCLVLPCFLWWLNNFINNGPDGNVWCYWKTSKSFVEVENLINFVIQNSLIDIVEKVYIRYYGLCNIVFEMTGEVLIDKKLSEKYHYVNTNYKVVDWYV